MIRCLTLVALLAITPGCISVSVIGQECEETVVGVVEWNFYTHVSCVFPDSGITVQGDVDGLTVKEAAR